MNRFLALLWLALLALAAPAAAQTFPERGRSPVVDQAGLLRPEQVLDLTSKSEALYAQTGRQFVVATVNSLEGRTIEDYGYRLGRYWKLGDEKRDDGVILLVAPKEKKVRIETGYGARVFLTDAMSSVIINSAILPRFREGDFGGGITAGADQIVKQMSLSPAEAQKRASDVQKQAQRSSDGGGFVPVLFWMIIILFVIMPMIRRAAGGRRYRRRGGFAPPIILWGPGFGGGGGGSSWGGGGGGGGFGGFSGGGGSFGGGGASGSW